MRDRMLRTLGLAPHLVICKLAPSIVDCGLSERESVAGLAAGPLRERALAAWNNYHTLVEVARSRVMREAACCERCVGTDEERAAALAPGLCLELRSRADVGTKEASDLPCNIRREGRAVPCNWRVIPCNI